MEKLIFSSLSVLLLLTAVVPGVKAQVQQEAESRVLQGEEYTEKRMSPSALVSAAYRGRYENWDIPGYANFEQGYRSGEITAEDLVSAGVEAGELTPQAANDDEYVNSVDSELDALITD